MREFTEIEKEWAKTLVNWKQDAKLEELQVARLVRKDLNCFALRWTLEPQKTEWFYVSEKEDSDIIWSDIERNYFKIADFLYFIEELEQEHLIKIQTLSFKNKNDNERILYDRSLYQYDSTKDIFVQKYKGLSSLIWIKGKRAIHIDFVDYLERYADKIVYPLPSLENLVKCDFKSIEQANYEEQLGKMNCSLRIAMCAVIVSAVVPFLVDRCSDPVKIDDAQLYKIEQAIKWHSQVGTGTIDVSHKR